MVGMGKRALTVMFAFFVAVFLLATGEVQAQGIGIVPSLIELDDVLRGGEYARTLTIVNQKAEEVTFGMVREGETAEWVSLHPLDDPATSLEQVVAPPMSDTRVMFKVTVPADSPNGPHSGVFFLQPLAAEEEEEGESRLGVRINLAVTLNVEVTGTQNLSAVIQDMYTLDVELGYPLRIWTVFRNDGNVKAQPEIRLAVLDAEGVVVGEASYTDTIVNPGQGERILLEWDTSEQSTGDFIAKVAVLLGESEIDVRELELKILPIGTLTRRGRLDELILENAPLPGAVAKITARFSNIGRIDTRAIFLGEAYRGSTLIEAVSSSEILVPIGGTDKLEIFVKVPESGTYTVRGKVNYEGKETEVMELTFEVGTDEGIPVWVWIGVAGGAIVGAGAVIGGRRALRRRGSIKDGPQV